MHQLVPFERPPAPTSLVCARQGDTTVVHLRRPLSAETLLPVVLGLVSVVFVGALFLPALATVLLTGTIAVAATTKFIASPYVTAPERVIVSADKMSLVGGSRIRDFALTDIDDIAIEHSQDPATRGVPVVIVTGRDGSRVTFGAGLSPEDLHWVAELVDRQVHAEEYEP